MTLENLLGFTDSVELAREEERLSKLRAKELFELSMLDNLVPGSAEALFAIHEQLFQDVYDFAGSVRQVDISKGSFRFAPCLYLEASLKSVASMPQSTLDEIIQKYVEMNVVHPFREGNGRSMRLWLDHILKNELGKVVDWRKVNKQDYLLAMERSPIKNTEIKLLISEALTDAVDDREVFMKGIDASYEYEGYVTYKTEML